VALLILGRSMEFRPMGEQVVLAALAVGSGRPVAIETPIDRIWADTPPLAVRTVVYSHLSRIRWPTVFRHGTGPSPR
jgi:DNA-binding SARP family transcriptional activator